MTCDSNDDPQQRVLLLPPTAKDDKATCALLARQGLVCVACKNLRDLSKQMRAGVGAVVLTNEAFFAQGIDEFLAVLREQPSWSDIPIVMLSRGGSHSDLAVRALSAMRNVTLLERPTPMRLLASAVSAAIRGRRWQYEIRDLLRSERSALAESERAGRMKDEFLATLSHELRTPLNAILGWSRVIRREGTESGHVGLALEIIERNALAQTRLIEDLLDMSGIISGKIRLDIQTLQPESFINAALDTVEPSLRGKGIRLIKDIDALAGPIAGDSNRLQQVIWNLLSNAIKFTPARGEVRVQVERQNGSVQIRVSDSGIGIAPAFLPHVYERFRQEDASTTRAHGGLGLGLAIVKHLVELHGGTIQAQSLGEGRGSAFTLLLPAISAEIDLVAQPSVRQRNLAPDSRRARSSNVSLKGVKVLVVDDEPDTRMLVKRILEDRQAAVITTDSVAEALSLLPLELPDVLVCDIGMPAMDGYELIRRVKDVESATGRNFPAIAFTGFARTEDRDHALTAGYREYLTKPVEPDDLVKVVEAVAHGGAPV